MMDIFFSTTGFAALNGIVLISAMLFALRFLDLRSPWDSKPLDNRCPGECFLRSIPGEGGSHFKTRSWANFFLSVFILASVQILLSQILPGLFGMLHYGNIWMINIIFLLAACILTNWKNLNTLKPPNIPNKPNNLKTSLPSISPLFHYSIIPILLLSPFFLLFSLRYANALLQVPLAYDDLAYHLPFAVEWLKTGSILSPYYTAFAGPIGTYPGNAELLDLWMMLPFGNDALVNLVNAPILIALMVAIFATARSCGGSRTVSLCVTSILMTLPVLLRLLGTALTDVFFVTTFVCALFFLLEYWRGKQRSDLFLFALAAGLCCGTKYLGIPYILPLVVVAVIIMFLRFCHGEYRRTMTDCLSDLPFLSALCLLLVGLLLGGGTWYLRNWWITGNPIFPTKVTLFGREILHGFGNVTEEIFGTSLAANVTDSAQWHAFFSACMQMTGLLGVMITIAWCVLLLLITKDIIRHQWKSIALPLTALLLLPLFFFSYWHAPFSHQILLANFRYALPLLAAGAVVLALCAGKSALCARVIMIATPCAIFLNLWMVARAGQYGIPLENRFFIDGAMILRHPALLAGVIALMIGMFSSIRQITITPSPRRLMNSGGILIIMLLISFILLGRSIPLREQYRHQFAQEWYGMKSPDHKYAIFEAARWLDAHAPDAAIAYSGLNMHYPLFGRDLQRNVRYININSCRNCRYHDFADAPDSIRSDPDYNAWLANLQAANIEYLVIDPVTLGIRSFESEWMEAHPERFKKTVEYGNVVIYGVIN